MQNAADHEVAVIGAGLSGIGTAIKLGDYRFTRLV
jgi:cation diffusion facilitator CzcD-associated flavoprotein CzcO